MLTVCAQNPSDSELEDRITKIIAEEDEEIIRQHCYDYRSPPAPASVSSLIRPSTTPSAARLVSNKSNSITARNCDASDIDDDELHQLLGVDWRQKFLVVFFVLCRQRTHFRLLHLVWFSNQNRSKSNAVVVFVQGHSQGPWPPSHWLSRFLWGKTGFIGT